MFDDTLGFAAPATGYRSLTGRHAPVTLMRQKNIWVTLGQRRVGEIPQFFLFFKHPLAAKDCSTSTYYILH